jgi:hypothetical protein
VRERQLQRCPEAHTGGLVERGRSTIIAGTRHHGKDLLLLVLALQWSPVVRTAAVPGVAQDPRGTQSLMDAVRPTAPRCPFDCSHLASPASVCPAGGPEPGIAPRSAIEDLFVDEVVS